MVTPGIGPATVGVSGLELLSAEQPATPIRGNNKSIRVNTFITDPDQTSPEEGNSDGHTCPFIERRHVCLYVVV